MAQIMGGQDGGPQDRRQTVRNPERRGWTPSLWASWKPFGIGEQRPNNYLEIARALRENSDSPGFAWRILSQGTCDGCALGTKGLRDWTLKGVHLCNVRLRLLRLNTIGPLDTELLRDVDALRSLRGADLRALGRIPEPMIRRKGEPGFSPITWDEALNLVAERIRQAGPRRAAFYLTSRGIPNETYYAAQKAVRAIGTNSIDNAARVCHSPSTIGLKSTIGAAATTCSYSDWIGTDLIVFVGSNPANNQPVSTKYLHHARKAGTRMVMVNTTREPGMERYWIPSVPESALFGTILAEQTYLINVGGDVAFLSGVMKHIVDNGWQDEVFVRDYTQGFHELKASLDGMPWEALERLSGTSRQEMLSLARRIGEAETAVFVWSMGITHHTFGVDGVKAIVNLALSKGFVGRDGCGLMPIRGHSGVQGGAEMGAYSTVLPGGVPFDDANLARFKELYGFELPRHPGLIAPEMLDAAHAGELDVLWSMGGNFMEVMPDPKWVEEGLRRIPLRVHQDIVLSSQMLVEPGEAVLLLPATTRYEIQGGVTQTSTERRIAFSPEIEGPRIAAARDEWAVFMDLARRVRPELADRLHFDGTHAIRAEIAVAVPYYEGIQGLNASGDSVQYGGPHLCADWKFDTPDGKAHFAALELPDTDVPPGCFRVATRRGKQFNSMVQASRDPLNGMLREAILIGAEDATALGVGDGDPIVLRNDNGELFGRARIAPLRPGNLEVHWPEGNVLIDPSPRAPVAGTPDYNAVVRLYRPDGTAIMPRVR